MPYRGTVSATTIANRKRVRPAKPQHPSFAVHYTPWKTLFRHNPVRDLRKMSEIVLGSIRVRKVGFREIGISQFRNWEASSTASSAPRFPLQVGTPAQC